MRSTGRPSQTRSFARTGHDLGWSGLSLGALAHTLLGLRASLARRLSAPLASEVVRREGSLAWSGFAPEPADVPREIARQFLMETVAHPIVAAPEPAAVPMVYRRERVLDPVPAEASPSPARPARELVQEGVRYTRTPDRILRERRAREREAALEAQRAEETARAAHEAQRLAQAAADQESLDQQAFDAATNLPAATEEMIPTWRRPFVLPPNVRFTRTPDHLLAKRAKTVLATQTAPPVETAPVETEVPAALAPDLDREESGAREYAGGFVSVPLDVTHLRVLSRRPIYTFERILPPAWPDVAFAPEQDNASAQDEDVPPGVEMAPEPPALAAPAPWEDEPEAGPAEEPESECAVAAEEIAEIEEGPPEPIAVPSRLMLVEPARPDPVPAPRRAPVAARAADGYELPSLELLAPPREADGPTESEETLADNAVILQQTLQDFGVRGEIIAVRPGPVVTLYELEPAPGTKSSRVISLADDIARSMSAVSARVAVVPGRNAIGIELPNAKRETVYLRALLAANDFVDSRHRLALCLGKTIGGEPVIADLARMPHLLVAGTTGSGKSVAINTMILSLLYRLRPEECRLIMVDPKMLELSVYDGIPHLLSPVVTDPKKAVIALKWAVREMEERYKKMSKVGVRNIDGFNARVAEAAAKGEVLTRTVQTGFDRETGEAVYEDEVMDLAPLPYIVVVVDEMADLMMVAGKDIEGAIQRLAQMARAAGIHLIMATQRPSVDVITGTIKANFPTRISFQVTSKIDSRTILGEMGAEQLLGQGDMLHMAGGGRITRVHGPFCSDAEVEAVVAHLKRQGRPAYLEAVTAEEDGGTAAGGTNAANGGGAAPDAPVFDRSAQGALGNQGTAPGSEPGEGDLYEQAVAVVLRDQKASTSYIQRRLQIGYNRAASIMERMENEGIVGPANHAGKREILVEGGYHNPYDVED